MALYFCWLERGEGKGGERRKGVQWERILFIEHK